MAIERERWIAMIKEGLVPDTSFLARSVDMSELVEYNKINMAEAGMDPKVLVDNSSYPVNTSQREDNPLELVLHTFDTENTVVRNIEEKESEYSKMESVVRSHRNALRIKNGGYAAYNWAPSANGDLTPVFKASGDLNASGQKKLTFEDLLAMRSWFVSRDVPVESVVLVLNAIHQADLMAEDMKQFKDILSGNKFYGVTVFTSSVLPWYTAADGTKKAFGSAVTSETDTQGSIMYCDTEVMRAVGDVEVFARYKDPQERGDLIGFQQRFTAMPICSKYISAIYSAKA